MSKKLTIEDVKNFIKDSGCKLLSTEYKESKSPLKIQCSCGKIFNRNFTTLKNAKRIMCKSCSMKLSNNPLILTKDKIKNEIENLGYKYISHYKNNGLYVDYEDKEGYKYHCKFDCLKTNKSSHRHHKSNIYTIYNIKHYIKINNLNVKLLSKKYIDCSSLLKFECSCGNIFFVELNKFINSEQHTCLNCSKKRVGDAHKLSFVDVQRVFIESGLTPLFKKYINSDEKLLCKTKDGYLCEAWLCNIQKGIIPDPFFETNPYLVYNFQLYVDKFTPYNAKILKIVDGFIYCKCSCGREFKLKRRKIFYYKFVCNSCRKKTSTGELIIKKWLDSFNIEYEEQQTFDGCKNIHLLRFDFYIKSKNLCIEIQGDQHKIPVDWFGGYECFLKQVKRDKIKKDYCKKHHIKLLEIWYEDIKNKKYLKILEENIK